MKLIISELPKEAQEKIPLSIRTYNNEYELEELPASIQTVLKKYLERSPEVSYNIVFDTLPKVSEYGDFQTIQNVTTLIVEYLKNYFMIFPEDYPFDPYFGSRLKQYLQMKDTVLQQTLITTEVNNIISVISADLNIKISIKEIKIVPKTELAHTEYHISIKVKINDSVATISF